MNPILTAGQQQETRTEDGYDLSSGLLAQIFQVVELSEVGIV